MPSPTFSRNFFFIESLKGSDELINEDEQICLMEEE